MANEPSESPKRLEDSLKWVCSDERSSGCAVDATTGELARERCRGSSADAGGIKANETTGMTRPIKRVMTTHKATVLDLATANEKWQRPALRCIKPAVTNGAAAAS